MLKTSIATTLLLGWLGLTGMQTARATTFLQFQSTALGNGWFQYQICVLNDPFFSKADITGLSVNFTNQTAQCGDGTNWGYSGNANGYSDWDFTNGIPARPYQTTFLVHSSETSWRLATKNFDGAIVLFSLMLSDVNPGYQESIGQNILGYASMPSLVPCSPAAADGSATNYNFTLKLMPDVNINHLIQTNGVISGVDFTWNYSSTFLLQGSMDLHNWTSVAYISSSPPETVWTTNVSLNSFGQFFRVELVGGEVGNSLPSAQSSASIAKASVTPQALIAPTTPQITRCQLTGNKIAVNVSAQTGQAVQVSAVDSQGVIQQSQNVTAQSSLAIANFDPASLPNPVYFKVAAVQ
ncbi:MAG TPA: hypothetical protein VK742_11110 [Candidatus Sulfotelmatobacter sp.]|nr:hypothetical protein [Candidatus Sulfotelmatobacter sp.]